MRLHAQKIKLLKASQVCLSIAALVACEANLPVKAQVAAAPPIAASAAEPISPPASLDLNSVPLSPSHPSPITQNPPSPPIAVIPRPVAAIKADCNQPNFEKHMVEAVNTARSKARQCGGLFMPIAGPLQWDVRLQNSAALHSIDMAKRDAFSHDTPDGRTFKQRIEASGYPWRSASENLASGQDTVDQVVREWLASPKHCEQMMNPNIMHFAVACAINLKSEYVTFWTMHLGFQ